jgi:hypothetical protein
VKDAQRERDEIQGKYTSMTRWFIVMLSSFMLLLLLFVGALVGVVQAGNVTVPGIGKVTVGSKGNPPPAPAEEPAPADPGE